ncbi:hypothetical protein I553_3463 [Mycobacterium xenopi 4042]|uniref:Uncharacterized protein n=1 Tax=Mycobacterium xenopi 4042 TaxID=1299334 RepID=X7ZZB2_MYCXE|nr:hypothetical protein I553_3463 [Mycobacterium xenopi 4042]
MLGATPNSSRLASMNSTISCVGGRAPPEETGRSLENLVGALEFSVFLFKLFDSARLRSRHPGAYPSSMSAWRTQERTDSTP